MNTVTIRELQKNDLWNGFLLSLDSLRQTSNIDKKKAEIIFEYINSKVDHKIFVAIKDENIVGSITVLIETKFIHSGGRVAHIEDVVVNNKHQGNKIGELLVKYALRFAEEQGCYKTILDCTDKVKPFYEKLGFVHNANALRFDHI